MGYVNLEGKNKVNALEQIRVEWRQSETHAWEKETNMKYNPHLFLVWRCYKQTQLNYVFNIKKWEKKESQGIRSLSHDEMKGKNLSHTIEKHIFFLCLMIR